MSGEICRKSDCRNVMQTHPPIFRVFCILGLLVTLAVGYWLKKNHEQLFGIDKDVPSENSGGRNYTKTQVFIVWIHAVLFFLGGALLLH